jgi:hypothetical protein
MDNLTIVVFGFIIVFAIMVIGGILAKIFNWD